MADADLWRIWKLLGPWCLNSGFLDKDLKALIPPLGLQLSACSQAAIQAAYGSWWLVGGTVENKGEPSYKNKSFVRNIASLDPILCHWHFYFG